jgi:hypothetical protein
VDLPIICTLTEDELKERRRVVLDAVRQSVLSVVELPLGYGYTFRPTPDALLQLSQLVDFERQCCKFLTFNIVVGPGDAPIRLEVTGPPNAKAVIEEFFGSSVRNIGGGVDYSPRSELTHRVRFCSGTNHAQSFHVASFCPES